MEYCVVGKGQGTSDMADKVITSMLTEYSRQLYGFTRAEFDSIVEYDALKIMSFYYSKMNAKQKNRILVTVKDVMRLSSMEDILDDYFCFDEGLYVPLSCQLSDKLGDARITMIVYETLFTICKEMTLDILNSSDSFSYYLVLLNAAYFNALAYKLHIRDSYKACMKSFYSTETFDEYIELLYEKNLDNLGWDSDVELDVLEDLIDEAKSNNRYDEAEKGEFFDAISAMDDIYLEHVSDDSAEDKEGFDFIVQKTGIKEKKCVEIHGFDCHFCDAKLSDDEYIIVYQKNARISEIIDKEEDWKKFQHDLYYEDIRDGKNVGMVYIVYILDGDSNNIPIQIIESNKTYGRKYVFTEEETITFINGIVKTTHDEIGAASPVQEWDRILREEHLTGCLTEVYSAKKVEGYLSGERFDADYGQDDDYLMLSHSVVPHVKWVKSLDTKGFRDFCFDDKVMEFGQINLFFGANGSGKTSVLEAIEYSLTSEVRRVKDFKVKMPSSEFPRLAVYDREAGVHFFTPAFSKKNTKEIERVWYGVPVGRTKSTLNENLNRFNAFDSEAAYKFIHESDNSEDSYAAMFGNLMFGESVVDHEKKWQRFKRSFNEKYTEMREELSSARYWVEIYESSISQHQEESVSGDIEAGIKAVCLIERERLPKDASERYKKLLEELTLIRKYIDILASQNLEGKTFGEIAALIAAVKRQNQKLVKDKKEKNDEIMTLTEKNGQIKQEIFDQKEKKSNYQEKIGRVNTDINNWRIVQNVLSHEDTIKLVNDLIDELTEIDRELYYISKIEQHPVVINFLKLDSYVHISVDVRRMHELKLAELKEKKTQAENRYNEAKKNYGEKEQQSIELRRIGKTLISDSKCPLCGHQYDSAETLISIIDSAVVVDDVVEQIILELQDISGAIIEEEKILERETLIEKAISELDSIVDVVPVVSDSGTDYKKIYDYVLSKGAKEKRKGEIIEQQAALDSQGFSLKNINACKEYKTSDPTYLEFSRTGSGSYAEYLETKSRGLQRDIERCDVEIASLEKQLTLNAQKDELLRNDIRRIDVEMEALDVDGNREYEQALENIKTKFAVTEDLSFQFWNTKYQNLFDKCELEVERLNSFNSLAFEKEQLQMYKSTVKRLEPQVQRCSKAVQAFEKMPSLSSFVEKGIKSNIQQISKFFKWMHHSGEFEELGIDEEGIYAIRGLNHEKIRTYQMSTGQRSTIAMAVMFALHMAAPDAPQFLLLDEPLATMDDTQVLNVLDILKSMADQGTQIFFTTANGIMINLFKECFKNTDFDYKEYQFIKRVNRPSEIKESSINNAKTIEELTLDDLTLDFNQFAQIREVLRKNQEKLVAKEDWEVFGEKGEDAIQASKIDELDDDNFFLKLTAEEIAVLNIIIDDDSSSASKLRVALSAYPMYKMICEHINEKAIDFFGETIIENDDELPWMDDDYKEDLVKLRNKN